ncbi:MAG: mechanosensitive ion channel family protein [Heliobacteriaceae bacterium]|nr:mechanosensitive ion channel family protein [Heliobacteriaceae bacterium]MDD4588239.1 mechanosensitive ion channel family protein [Heliobacteriaceae bacterium]
MFNWLKIWLSGQAVYWGLGDWGEPLAVCVVGFIQLLVVVVAVKLTLRFGGMFIDRLFRQRTGTAFFEERRAVTLAKLLKSVLLYVVFFIAGVVVLDTVFGFETRALLAGAGVVGLAIGVGAQNLVRDVITGFFVIFENQYVVGDYVTIGKFTGIVEEIGLRVTRLRDYTGELHIIPNGEIKEVTNLSRGPILAMVDISVAYEEDIDRVLAVLREAGRELAVMMPAEITDGPEVLGVTKLGPSEVVIRINANAVPMMQWKVEREMRRYFKLALDRAGIEIPYPRQVYLPFEEKT